MIGIRLSDDIWEIISELWLKNPNNTVVSALYNFNVKRDDMDYLDLKKVEEEIMFSYLPTNRIKDCRAGDFYATKLRQECRIGKALKKILATSEFKESDLKEVVEQIQIFCKDSQYEILVVSGKDIREFYLESNYKPSPNSELGKSCMRYKRCQDWLGLYEDDSNLKLIVCRRRGLVTARALIWEKVAMPMVEERSGFNNQKIIPTLKKTEDLVVLDRIYSVNPTAKAEIQKWALENTDLQLARPREPYSFFSTELHHEINPVYLTRPLENYKFRGYPYVDTFMYYNVESKLMSNSNQSHKGFADKFIQLQSAEGRFTAVNTGAPTFAKIQEELDLENPALKKALSRVQDVLANVEVI